MSIFFNKKILIYGLGKSGLSSYEFLKKKNEISLFDDFQNKFQNLDIKKKFIDQKIILKTNFDQIILSPGIDIDNCKLSKFLKKNRKKIYSDLDIFYSFYKNDTVTITGTNGKSTTCQLLYEVLLNQKLDVRLVGNIGNPILSSKNVKKKTIFIIEASSYQLEYSKIFRSKYAVILNISPDHIERHKSLNNYVKAKFKLLKNQVKGNLAFVKDKDPLIKKQLQLNKFQSRIINVNTQKIPPLFKKIDNRYFLSETNKENLSFVIKISKKLNLRNDIIIKTIKEFKGLMYRQQIVLERKNLTIINDSKSTSFSSSVGLLKSNDRIFWLIGGISKKGDIFNLPSKYFKNIKAFIYGKDKNFFNKKLKNKIELQNFDNIEKALKKILFMIKKDKSKKKIILFSPSAASFDIFNNFEERGMYFNKLIKRYFYEI